MASDITQRQRAEQFYNSLLKSAGVLGYETPRGRFKRLQLLLAHDQQTRQEALLECAKVARNRADLYKPKLGLWLNMVNYHRSQEADDLADTLDRLAQEGAPSIDLSTTIQDDGGYGEYF